MICINRRQQQAKITDLDLSKTKVFLFTGRLKDQTLVVRSLLESVCCYYIHSDFKE